MAKLHRLEAIRGAAAVYVMLGHVLNKKLIFGNVDVNFLLSFGQEAVILFFILSGFVIWYSYTKSEDQSFQTYFMKRFLRIYIPLLLVFCINYLLFCYQENEWLSIDAGQLFGNLFMLQDTSSLKPNVICNSFLGNSTLWSLSYEWWFYMLFYFLYKKYKDRSIQIGYIIGCIAVLSYLIYPFFVNRICMYMVIWFVGAELAMLYMKGEHVSIRNMKYGLSALCFCTFILILNVLINKDAIHQQLGLTGIGISPFLELRHFCFAIAAIAISILWSSLKWKGFDRSVGLFEPAASISYVLYISHWFMIVKATYLNAWIANELVRIFLYMLICVGVAYIIERVIYPACYKLFLRKEVIKLKKVL